MKDQGVRERTPPELIRTHYLPLYYPMLFPEKLLPLIWSGWGWTNEGKQRGRAALPGSGKHCFAMLATFCYELTVF
jgi:hypothetical protein